MFKRISRHHVWVCLAYLLVAAWLIAPVLGSLSTRFVGGDTGDAYEMARQIWWYKTALETGDDPFFQSLLAYPDGFPAMILWANPLQFFPMWLFAFFVPLALAYNLGILLTLTLNGCAMHMLACKLLPREHRFPALIAGLVYLVSPVIQGHLFSGHAGLLVQWPVPLLLLFLFQYINSGGGRNFLLSVMFFFLAAMGHSLQSVYLLAPLAGLFFFARLFRRDYVGATRLILVGASGSLLLLLFLSPILSETLQTSQFPAAGGFVRYSIDLLGAVSPSFENPFWREIVSHSQRVLGVNLGEGASYLGVIGGLLALVGLFRRRETRWWLLVALVSWLLALGPVLKVFDQALTLSIAGYRAVIPLPYAVFVNLPVVELARTPGRFMFLFSAAFAIMAGYGMSVLWASAFFQRRNRFLRYGMALLLTLLLLGDYQFFEEFPSVPAAIPAAIHELKDRANVRAIYNVPYDNLLAAKEALYLQTAHGKPLIAGHETRVTPVDPARLTLLSSFHRSLLAEAGADIVIVNKVRAQEDGKYDALYWSARNRLGAPIFEDARFAIFETGTPSSNAVSERVYSVVSDAQSHTAYAYKQQPGWLEFRATLRAANRRVRLSLNDVPLQSVTVVGEELISLPLPIARRGYNTFRIALDPPCPEQIDATVLLCYGVTMEDVVINELTSGAIYDPIRIADGIELSGYHVSDDFAEDPVIHFWWSFDSARTGNDVRFVHVLDQDRRLEDQDDDSFGVVPAGSDHLESVTLAKVRELPPGNYTVLTGWYSLPDAIRYDVLTNVEGAQDNTIVLGTFEIDE